jgi:hypothetical protein
MQVIHVNNDSRRKAGTREEATMRVLTRLAIITGLVALAGTAAAQQVTVRMWMHEHPPRPDRRSGEGLMQSLPWLRKTRSIGPTCPFQPMH